MCTEALQHVYKSIVVAKLLYAAASAWCGFTSKQSLQTTVRRGVRSGLYDPGIPTVLEFNCLTLLMKQFSNVL